MFCVKIIFTWDCYGVPCTLNIRCSHMHACVHVHTFMHMYAFVNVYILWCIHQKMRSECMYMPFYFSSRACVKHTFSHTHMHTYIYPYVDTHNLPLSPLSLSFVLRLSFARALAFALGCVLALSRARANLHTLSRVRARARTEHQLRTTRISPQLASNNTITRHALARRAHTRR